MVKRNSAEEDLPKSKINARNLKKTLRLFHYMSKTNKWLFLLGTLFLAITAGASIIFPKLLGNMMDGVFVYNKGDVSKAPDANKLKEIATYFVYLFLIQAVFSFLRIAIYVRVTESMTLGLRSDLFKSVIGQNLDFFNNNRVGDILSRFSADITQIQDTFTTNIAMFIRQILIMIGGIILIFMSSSQLSVYMISTMPIIIVIALFFGRFIRKISKEVQNITAGNNIIVEESISGIVNVKAYTNEDFESKRYIDNAKFLQKETIKRGYLRGAFSSFIIVCLFGSIVWLIFMGLNMVQSGEMAIGELFNFMLLTAFVGSSIGGMAEQFVQIQKTLGAVERVFEIIDTPTESNVEGKTPDFKQNIVFNSIQFKYPSRPENLIIKDLSCVFEAGKTTAIVGPSGSGKTTISALIYQFYQPNQGEILLGDQNINKFNIQEFRNHFALVPQDVSLFGGTIYDNILYGNPSASKEQVIEAAKEASALKFIENFPEGFQTTVGDRGMKLSGGQKQRIAIARAILRNPDVLILDEATSALDSESEYEVQLALNKLMLNRTSIIIAHRLSTIRNANTILVIHNGRIAESGNHQQLISQDVGIYKKMVERQLDPSEYFKELI
jgi:ABC-type multidrug transport system fused ATPase/permease subunit